MNIILPFTINNDIKQQILSFALEDGLNFFIKNPAGNHRKYCNLNKTDTLLKNTIKSYSDSLFGELGMTETKEETTYGNFIGIISEGGFVHNHIDSRSDSKLHHVRINFLIQKPISGGEVIINEQTYSIEENQAWLNLASEWFHSSTPVIGERERIVLSLGKFVNPNQIKTEFIS